MPQPLKDLFFNTDTVQKLAELLQAQHPIFDIEFFKNQVLVQNWSALNLKQRLRHITLCMHESLALPYIETLRIFEQVAPAYTGFGGIIFPEYVELFGLDEPALSFQALEYLTQFSTAEYAIRPFIERYRAETLTQIQQWTTHGNEHVRRLASEGLRPRLPWGKQLKFLIDDPSPALPILEALKADESEYVRRSVANHLNDISKDHPNLVLAIAERWQTDEHPHTNRILTHALRTLLKKGNTQALQQQGVSQDTEFVLNKCALLQPNIAIGESLDFEIEIQINGNGTTPVRIEYQIEYVKADGTLSPKVFHLFTRPVNAPTVLKINRNRSFVNLSTRKHYPGTHYFTLLLNGLPATRLPFELS